MKLHMERKFDAAHRLPNYEGKCKNLHGHTWKVVVDIEGCKNPKTEMIIDFNKLKKTIDKYDHAYLNDFIENPTAENLAEIIADDIKKLDNTFSLIRVKVYESDTNYIEVRREQF